MRTCPGPVRCCWGHSQGLSHTDNLDPGGHQKLLMKTGLILIVIGHLNFIVSALVHGTVLRYVANPQDTISLQYAVSNIVAVSSTLLVRLHGWRGAVMGDGGGLGCVGEGLGGDAL